MQDFPLKTNSATDPDPSSTNKLASKFTESLILMLRGMNAEAGIKTLLDDRIIQLPFPSTSLSQLNLLESILSRYDFSKVKVALVCSVPGKFQGAEMQTVGHTGLMRALRNIGARCHSDKQIALECQVSTLVCFSVTIYLAFI